MSNLDSTPQLAEPEATAASVPVSNVTPKSKNKKKKQGQQGSTPDLGSKAVVPEGRGMEEPVAANAAASASALEGATKLKEDAEMDSGVPEDKAATTVASGRTPKRKKRKMKKKNKMQELLESPQAVFGVVSEDKIAANKSGNCCTDGVGTSEHADVDTDPINGEDPSCVQSVATGADDLEKSKDGIKGNNSCSENNGLLQESSAGRKRRKRKRNQGLSNGGKEFSFQNGDGVANTGLDCLTDHDLSCINGKDPSCAQSVATGADDLEESKDGIKGNNSCSENNGLLQESSTGRKRRKKKRNQGSSNGVEIQKEKIKSIYSPRGSLVRFQRKKLLILDLNGLLADINQDYHNAHIAHAKVRAKLVFKRPYCDDFLKFCFQNFELGIWSSRKRENVNSVVNILMKNLKQYLLFCWDMSRCTVTGCKTIDNNHKPLVLKQLKKLWNKEDPSLPWEQGEFSPSNTLLVDDSPYKALCNPPNTAIFPYPYSYLNEKDDYSLGPGGDLRVYLERIAAADNVQNFVRDNPFGQKSITEIDPNWEFYAKIVDKVEMSLR